MNYKQFAKEYDGVSIDYDMMYGAQCVDVVRFYWHKVCGLVRARQPDTTPSGGAKDLINNVKDPSLKVFKEPKGGDVVVFGPTKNNQWGHTAVVMEFTNEHIEVVEQDGLNQGAGMYWKVRPRNELILGYIRYLGG